MGIGQVILLARIFDWDQLLTWFKQIYSWF